MTPPRPVAGLPADPAVLLVLLPPALTAAARQLRVLTLADLGRLQLELGAAIHVLQVDEATHPAVVHSFDGRGLPAFVLTHHGVELWREQGLPDATGLAALLLSKLTGAPNPRPAEEAGPA